MSIYPLYLKDMDIDKSSGIMHPTALPASMELVILVIPKKFIDFLHDTSTNIWQVLPLG